MSIAPKAEQRQIGIHRVGNMLGEFSHGMSTASGDVPSGDATLRMAMYIGTQHRLDDVVDIDEIENLRASRDRNALAFA